MYDWSPDTVTKDTFGVQCKPKPKLVNLTERIPEEFQPYLWRTLGIRSAGAHNGVVFYAGPGIAPGQNVPAGVNIFAFDACTGDFLAVTNLPEYSNIRKWLVAKGELYVGVGSLYGGAVLKWIGDRENLFEFEVVGSRIDGIVSELCFHEERIFVTTWPGRVEGAAGVSEAGLWMSPKLDPALSSEDTDGWDKVWSMYDYEPDPVTALTYGGGALASFDGYLYWGTMHVPLTAALAHFEVYGKPEDKLEMIMALLGTWRAISIFRGKNLEGRRWDRIIDLRWGKRIDPRYTGKVKHSRWNKEFTPRIGKRFDPFCGKKIELLYVEWFLPVYTKYGWRLKPNKMGVTGMKPKCGHSGFGNLFNNYCWTMAVYNKELYVGTMDWSYLIFGTLDMNVAGYDFSILDKIGLQGPVFGADLYFFPNSNSRAKAVNLEGMGNPMNYGIRTMVSSEALYLGSANPMNLHEKAGWEFIYLKSY
jgi:hypothetical protein